MVGAGFSPGLDIERTSVAERRLIRHPAFNCCFATKSLLQTIRGLKPTATIVASLREAAAFTVSLPE